jgi:hypothetical protein
VRVDIRFMVSYVDRLGNWNGEKMEQPSIENNPYRRQAD